ncbi:MAG: hypothetical protein RL172_2162 [Bacteroidota bacterium]|jgi:hypothetical protein
MKKLFFLALITVSVTAKAQVLSIGLKAGANISNFTGTPVENVSKKALVGFYGGAFFNIWIAKTFSIQPEALISTQGAKIENAGQSENLKLTYLSVPVMLKFRSMGGFYFEAGPQFGFKISDNNDDEDFDYKGLDLAAGVGLGYHGKGGFGIGARYLAGLSKVGDFDPGEGINPDFKNSVIQVGVFFTLGTPKK